MAKFRVHSIVASADHQYHPNTGEHWKSGWVNAREAYQVFTEIMRESMLGEIEDKTGEVYRMVNDTLTDWTTRDFVRWYLEAYGASGYQPPHHSSQASPFAVFPGEFVIKFIEADAYLLVLTARRPWWRKRPKSGV